MRPPLSFTNVTDARNRLRHTGWCARCEKLSLFTEADARIYVGLILTHPHLLPGTFALVPYRCPHNRKTWHVGRNSKTLHLDFTAGHIQARLA